MNEVWKDVVGYEGIYEVSNIGQIRTHKHKTTYTKLHGNRKWQQRILKQKTSKDNTCRVNIWKNGKAKTVQVHRLVAMAFIPAVEGKEFVNHIDGSRLNNHASNLEWCTYKENTNHAFDNDLMTSNHKTVLVNIDTKETRYFRSMAHASLYLGKSEQYLSGQIIKGNYVVDNHQIFMHPEKLLQVTS